MSENEPNTDELQAKIAELEKENQKLKNEDTFDELKNKYEKIIEDKNNEITNLKSENDKIKQKVDDTVDELKDEVQQRLDANEEYQNALATIKELEVERAETTVDTYIQKGVILPAQRETALKLCLNDNDTFTDLYKDAKPVVDVEEHKSKRINSLAKGLSYFDKD
jgi:chromosome segregation ATPase